MNEKELRSLTREQLLEIMLEQSREIMRLESEICNVKEQLSKRAERLAGVRTLAEASCRMNGLEETVRAAGRQYLENVLRICGEKAEAAGAGATWRDFLEKDISKSGPGEEAPK